MGEGFFGRLRLLDAKDRAAFEQVQKFAEHGRGRSAARRGYGLRAGAGVMAIACKMFEDEEAQRRGEIGIALFLRTVTPVVIDFLDQVGDGAAGAPRDAVEAAPEIRLQADRGLVAPDDHGSLADEAHASSLLRCERQKICS